MSRHNRKIATLDLASSMENIPLIRKFAVTFFFMSILPCVVIFLLTQSYLGEQAIDEYMLLIVLCSMAIGTISGFLSMRKSILRLHNVTSEATQSLAKRIPSLASIKPNESEVTQLIKTFNEVTLSLENNIKRLEASKKVMQYVLSKLAVGISSLQTIDTFLELIVEITANAVDANMGLLFLLDEDKQELYVKSASGFNETLKSQRIKFGDGPLGMVAQSKKPLLLSWDEKNPVPLDKGNLILPPLLAAPMLYKERLIGVLAVSEKLTAKNFQEEELIIISNIASQTAVAVENDRLHVDAERTYFETISALAMAVEARDYYSRGHSDRVADYAAKTAEKLGLDADFIKDMKVAGELHDVGKIGISDDLLKKASKLSDEEWQIMRRHPVIGEGIIKPLRSLSKICPVIRQHHEWLDGTGYPDRLKGDQIVLGAKILAVADSYDAMTTNRSYRTALNSEVAKEELKKYIGIRYDKAVIEAFLSVI